MPRALRRFFGLKGDTKTQLADKYVSGLNGKARADIVQVSTSLQRLQKEVLQFQEAIDKLNKSFPGYKKI